MNISSFFEGGLVIIWDFATGQKLREIWHSRNGALRVEDLMPLLNSRTRLVQVSLVSFFNGFMIPLAAVVETVRQNSPALLAVDVTQYMVADRVADSRLAKFECIIPIVFNGRCRHRQIDE